MRFLRTPIRIIRRDRRAFLVLNGVAFGFFLVGFVLGLIFPELVRAQLVDLETSGQGSR